MNKSLHFLRKNAGPLIQLQLQDAFDLSSSEVDYYKEERKVHPLVKEVLAWQGDDGYIGQVFHGGWLPENKKVKSSKAFEAGFRFLHQASYTIEDEIIQKALPTLFSNDFNRSYTSWDIYSIEDGLYGDDCVRAYLYMLFGNDEEIPWVKQSIIDAVDAFRRLTEMKSTEDAFFVDNKNRYVVNKRRGVPDLYHLRLLAYTTSWRTDQNMQLVRRGLTQWFSWEMISSIYANYQGQRIAMAKMRYVPSKSIKEFSAEDWNRFFEIMYLLKLLGMQDMKEYQTKRCELINVLEANDGVFDVDVKHRSMKTWGAYSGIRLEDKWTKKKRQVDLTFRVYQLCF